MGSGSSSTKSSRSTRVTNETVTKVTVTTQVKDVPHYKIVLIGEPYVGKSSLYYRYIKNQFFDQYLPSKKCSVENVVRKLNLPQNQVVSVTMWDLPGREDMDIRESYFRNVDAAIVVVDMDNLESISMAATWKQEFLNKASQVELVTNEADNGVKVATYDPREFDAKKIPVLLLGNKYDLVEEKLAGSKLWMMKEDEVDPGNHGDDPPDDSIADTLAAKLGLDLDLNQIDDPADNKALSEDGDSNNDGRPFTPIRGPKEGQRKPECVLRLEQVQKQHGFVGSVIVSARENDNSIYLAIQSLIRHLLERQMNRRMKVKQKVKKKKKKKAEPLDPDMLTEVKKKQLDLIARRCNQCIKRLHLVFAYYESALKSLKQACADGAIITQVKCSLEDCINGIKNGLPHGKELRAEEDDGFLALVVDGDPTYKVHRDVTVALEIYHEEYALVCKSILRDFPVLDDLMSRLDDKISKYCENITETFPELSNDEAEAERLLAVCEKNRAKIAHMRKRLQDYLDIVATASDKIKTALIW